MQVEIKTRKKINVEIGGKEAVNVNMPNVLRTPIVYDKNYLFIQNQIADEWFINHNLNKYPSVTVIDSADNEVVGEIEYIDKNNLKIKFASGFSGKATLN